MDTNYHLALQTPQGNLQRLMRHINGLYTQRFNRAHKRGGPLFQGLYKDTLINADKYLASVVCYIHLTPLEANKADDPKDYPWSSHHHYLRPIKKHQGGFHSRSYCPVIEVGEIFMILFYLEMKMPF